MDQNKGGNQSGSSSDDSGAGRRRQGQRRRAERRRSATSRSSGNETLEGTVPSNRPDPAVIKKKKPTSTVLGICWPSWNRRSKAIKENLKEQEEASIVAAVSASMAPQCEEEGAAAPDSVSVTESHVQAQAEKLAALRVHASLENNRDSATQSLRPRATKPGAVACDGDGQDIGDQPDTVEAAKIAMLFGHDEPQDGGSDIVLHDATSAARTSNVQTEAEAGRDKRSLDAFQLPNTSESSSLMEPSSMTSTSVSGESDLGQEGNSQESRHHESSASSQEDQIPRALVAAAPRQFKAIQEEEDWASSRSMTNSPPPSMVYSQRDHPSPRSFAASRHTTSHTPPPSRFSRQQNEQAYYEPRYEPNAERQRHRREPIYDQVVPPSPPPRSRREFPRATRRGSRYGQEARYYEDAISAQNAIEMSEHSFQSDCCYSETSRTMSMTDHLDASNSSYGTGRITVGPPRYSPAPAPTPPPRDPPNITPPTKTIEVSPGLYLRLRGAKETLGAVKRDFFNPCLCSACTAELFCISDASFVICPHCRVFTPLWGTCDSSVMDVSGGVGLGFTVEDLERMQWDAIAEEEMSRQHQHSTY